MSASAPEVSVRFRGDGIEELRTQVQALTTELERAKGLLVSGSPRISILKEPLTYEARLVRDRTGPMGLRAVGTRENHSYIRDRALAERSGDQGARDRLRQHEEEMRTIGSERERLFHPDVEHEFEQRAVNWTSGTGGYFAPPLWLVEEFAYQPTPERVLAKLAPQFELPEGVQSVNIPAWTQGADVGVAQVGAAGVSQDVVDVAISSAVATIAGNFDVPLQMLEQSPQGAHLDWIAFSTMEARYGYKLELQLLTGTGPAVPQGSGNNQLIGILSSVSGVPTGNQIIYTDATPTVLEFIQPQATLVGGGAATQMIAAIGNSRKLPPEIWMMTTSRGAWVGAGEISMFPLAVANQSGPGEFDMLAYPVKLNDAIPTTLGAAGNQDTVICCRPSDWIILESERRTQVMMEPLSGTLQARLQMRRYVAALIRRPSSVAYVSGTGMVVQPGF